MKFGIFYEHQLPRPWNEGDEHRLFQEALDQVELADKLGIDYAWEVEHHFLEEYSHSSAPEIFLAACSQRTKRIRLGHGICLMPPKYNHPARVAERIATLDLVSNGRVEFGTGESASLMELGGFNVGFDAVEKRRMWTEAVEQCADMMVMNPYPGFKGEFFEMPCRNIVPKPVQKPHPPVWVACSNRETIKLAARLGIGPFPRAALAMAGEIDGWLATMAALDAEDRLRAELAASRLRDAEAGTTSCGPHRSDLAVRHLDLDLPAAEGSTGQQKAVLVSIALAHARLVALSRGRAPLLLLDEIAAHLDAERRTALFDEVVALGVQSWMTGTDAGLFAPLGGRAQILRVADGSIAAV